MERDEVLELIERAAREEWTELDLSNKELKELPPSPLVSPAVLVKLARRSS